MPHESKTERDKRTAEYNRTHPNEHRKYVLKSLYGITVEQYNEVYSEQEGKCAICHSWFPVLGVDHNHNTKRIRGLLCRQCNLVLGNSKENILVLESAIKYLQERD